MPGAQHVIVYHPYIILLDIHLEIGGSRLRTNRSSSKINTESAGLGNRRTSLSLLPS